MNDHQHADNTNSATSHLTSHAQQVLYSQQVLLQPPYMSMPAIYGAQQMIQPSQIEVQAFQQQQLLQAMQQRQQQQHVLHGQQSVLSLSHSNELVQQQAVLQQQHYQRALQQAAHQQQQQRQLEQQSLLQQQQQQLDLMHQEREAARLQQHQELLRQKAEEAMRQQQECSRLHQEEVQRRLQYQNEQHLKQQREMQERLYLEQERLEQERIKKEEANRLAEEQRKREEQERKELEKIIAVREEQRRKQRDVEESMNIMREKANSIPIAISLTGCHVLTKLVNHLPFPQPLLPQSEYLEVSWRQFVPPSESDSNLILDDDDHEHAMDLLHALQQVDVSDVSLKHEDMEDSHMNVSALPRIIKNIALADGNIFNDVASLDLHTADISVSASALQREDNIVGVKNNAISSPQESATSCIETIDPIVSKESAVLNYSDIAGYATSSHAVNSSQISNMDIDVSVEMCGSYVSSELNSNDMMTDRSIALFDGSSSPSVDHEQTQLRRQIVSLGKQPKAHPSRKKRDMVESLIDSLTPFFGITKERRNRQKTKTFEEEQHERMQMELFAQMELAEEKEKAVRDAEHCPDHVGTSSEVGECMDEPKFFECSKTIRKRGKQRSLEHLDRPITPPEVIQKREDEWREREKKRKEKYKRRQNDMEECFWNNDARAENGSYNKFMSIIEKIFDNIETMDIIGDENEVPQDFLIDKTQLSELHCEAQKLKSWKMINKVNPERIVKLMAILEKNIRDVISVEGNLLIIPSIFNEVGDGASDDVYREMVVDRILRAADASCTAMIIMTSTHMPKQVFIEDTIERSIQVSRLFLNNIVYPASDTNCGTPVKSKKNDDRKRKTVNQVYSRITHKIYQRMTELIACFSELVQVQSLTDTAVLQLCTMSISPFFVDNVFELQIKCVKLLTAVFSRYEAFRKNILQDLLNSLHRLPHSKNARNSCLVSGDHLIGNLTLLIMQLVQCVMKIPKRHKIEENSSIDVAFDSYANDSVVKESYNQAQDAAIMFLKGFLGKCSSKSEEDYRRLFDQFLHDLLAALYRPEWPAAEGILHILGNLLITFYRSKNMDMSLRVASLDYLGTIAARLRQCRKLTSSDSTRLDNIVRYIVYDELDESEKALGLNSVAISHLNLTEKIRRVKRAFIDYLIEKKAESDMSTEHAIMFHIGEWYKSAVDDCESIKCDAKNLASDISLSEKDKKSKSQDLEKLSDDAQFMKKFYINLGDRTRISKRAKKISRTGVVLSDGDALWIIQYFASTRDFSQSFIVYLKQILYGIHAEQAVGLRTKAMRCLSLIIESDLEVLTMPEVHTAVHARMVDPNAAVREATIDLIGKYVVAKPDYVHQYYSILVERIKDSGVAVRKRVIRIMREICEKHHDFSGIPEMLSKIVRRVKDEEGIKKITIETFHTLFFQSVRERDSNVLVKKVMTLTDVVLICVRESIINLFEQLLNLLLKNNERTVLLASKQIVDTLVDNVLALDSAIAASDPADMCNENDSLNYVVKHKEHQEKLLACLTTLSLFSKVRPDLMIKHAETLQPYLSMNMNGQLEQQVMDQVINMLGRVVPLMEHPSDTFLKSLDESLCLLVNEGNMKIIHSALACISAIYNKSRKWRPAVIRRFLSYLRFLNQTRVEIEMKQGYIIPKDKSPVIQRALYSVGIIVRFLDVDEILKNDPDAKLNLVMPRTSSEIHEITATVDRDHEDEVKTDERPFSDSIFQILTLFCRNRDGSIRMKALIAIGNFCAVHVEYLCRQEMRNMYMTLLGLDDREYLALKIQTLKNIELFLLSEENKLAKNNDDWHNVKAEQDLKEMELANSGMASTIIQIYWNAILNSYFNSEDEVRMAAVKVVVSTLGQGLVTPGSSIPTLIAMSTDSILSIRNKADNMLKDIDTKYTGMVPSKAVSGIRCGFRLHRLTRERDSEILRGIRPCGHLLTTVDSASIKMKYDVPKYTNDGQAILSGLYQSLRTNRQIRRSFLSSVLRLFSEDCREKLALEEWLFVTDNLAMFPYQVLDEPLYVIRQIESIVSVSGQNIINSFISQLLPSQSNGEDKDDDTQFDAELIYRRLPEDKSLLYECLKNSQACFLLLYLKTFLMKLYGFSEIKVQEYSPSEAAKVYEKSLSSRKNIAMFFPFTALQELEPEAASQRDTVSGHINMANQIVYFRNMLLSLDQTVNEEEIDSTNTKITAKQLSPDEGVITGNEGAMLADEVED